MRLDRGGKGEGGGREEEEGEVRKGRSMSKFG